MAAKLPIYKVLVLGTAQVGKTGLVRQVIADRTVQLLFIHTLRFTVSLQSF